MKQKYFIAVLSNHRDSREVSKAKCIGSIRFTNTSV